MSMLASVAAIILAEREEELWNVLDSEQQFSAKWKSRGPTREWVKQRAKYGNYKNLRQELLLEDPLSYKYVVCIDVTCISP